MVYPIVFVFICAFLVILPIFDKPFDTGMGILITLSGIPAYLIGVKWTEKPKWFNKRLGNCHSLNSRSSKTDVEIIFRHSHGLGPKTVPVC
jgi:hypothetical protein